MNAPFETIKCSNCGQLLFEFRLASAEIGKKGYSSRAPSWGVTVIIREPNKFVYEIFCPACEHVEIYAPERELWFTNNAPCLVWQASGGLDAPNATTGRLFPTPVRFKHQEQYNSGPIKECVAAFAANIERVAAIGQFSIRIAGLNRYISRNDELIERWKKSVEQSKEPFEWSSNIGKLIKGSSKHRWKLFHCPIPEKMVSGIDHSGLGDLIRWSESHTDIKLGVATLLSTQLALAWTAFEMLAGDLWVAAVNFQPVLATKFGAKMSGGQGKSISIEALSEYGSHDFNLSSMMGDVLREKADFRSLRKIKLSYKQAFGKTVPAMENDDLCLLELLRNLIMHKAGNVDSQFEDDLVEHKIANHPACANIKRGHPFVITSLLTMGLVGCAVKCGQRLISFVSSELGLGGLPTTSDQEIGPSDAN